MVNQKGVTVWFTCLPCSGKTTIADKVAEFLSAKGYKVERLDGDSFRKELSIDVGFSKEDREENLRRAAYVAKLLTRNGVIVLASFVSPYSKTRNKIRNEIGDFIEVYVECSPEICKKRDVKGMYKKALAGEIKDFTGVNDPYEIPESPEIVIDTNKNNVEESANIILKKLRELRYI